MLTLHSRHPPSDLWYSQPVCIFPHARIAPLAVRSRSPRPTTGRREGSSSLKPAGGH